MLTKRQRKGIRRGAVLPLTLAWVGLVGAALGFLPQIDVCAPPPFLDADRDGVINPLDRCPNTPADADVDVRGCAQSQLDDDADGVMNDVDQCANTPAGETADATGCSCTQLDSDNDGVDDCDDLCPGTAEGATVDADGCADEQLDDDGDGVANGVDMCSNTPEGETVDADGCSESQLDDDADGVMNNVDQCADTPEGEAVDADGCSCSQLDADDDGVNDCDDLCADTPEGTEVNDDGCPTTAFTVSAGSDLTATGGDVLTVSATVTNAEGTVTYAWTADDSGLTDGTVGLADDTTATVTVTLSADAAGSVDLTVTATNGDADATTASATITITIGAAPFSVTISGPTVATGGQTVTLTAVAAAGQPPINFWWQTKATGTAGSATMNPASGVGQTIQITFSADAEGTFIFEVLATDNTTATVEASKNIDVTPTAAVIPFTDTIESLTGTSQNDTFTALVDAGGGNATYQPGDSADGAAGTDRLKLTASGNNTAVHTGGVTLDSIEQIWTRVVSGAGSVIDTALFTGVEQYWSDRSLAPVQYGPIPELAELGIYKTDQGLVADFDEDGALAGPDDTVVLNLDQCQEGAAVVISVDAPTDAEDGVETVEIKSGGTVANVLDAIMDGGEGTMTGLIISGAQDLTLGDPDDLDAGGVCEATIETVDASGLTGNLSLDASDFDGRRNLTITCGTGDDTIGMNGSGTNQSIDGNDGSDVIELAMGAAQTYLNRTSTTDVENIKVVATLAGATVDLGDKDGLESLTVIPGAATVDFTVVKAEAGVVLAFEGSGEAGNQAFNGVNFNLDDDSGDNDSLAITVGNDGVAIGSNKLFTTGTIMVDGIESVTVTVADGHADLSNGDADGFEGDALTDLALVSSGDLTLDIDDTGADNTGVSVSIDATGVEGDLTLVVADGGDGAADDLEVLIGDGSNNSVTTGDSVDTVVGGAGDDTIAMGAEDDEADGGPGEDTISGDAGNDALTGGPGDDTFVYSENGAANVDSIDDFQIDDSGTDDKISVNAEGGSPDLEACNSTDLTGGEAIVLVAHAINTNVNLSATATNVIRLTAVNQGTFAAAIGTGVITVADGANPLILWYDVDTGEAVLGSAVEGGGTDNAIDTADVFTEIVRFSVTTTEYGNFDGDNIQLH